MSLERRVWETQVQRVRMSQVLQWARLWHGDVQNHPKVAMETLLQTSGTKDTLMQAGHLPSASHSGGYLEVWLFSFNPEIVFKVVYAYFAQVALCPTKRALPWKRRSEHNSKIRENSFEKLCLESLSSSMSCLPVYPSFWLRTDPVTHFDGGCLCSYMCLGSFPPVNGGSGDSYGYPYSL